MKPDEKEVKQEIPIMTKEEYLEWCPETLHAEFNAFSSEDQKEIIENQSHKNYWDAIKKANNKKNYRHVDLPDCCANCGHFWIAEMTGDTCCTYTGSPEDTDIDGLCDNHTK